MVDLELSTAEVESEVGLAPFSADAKIICSPGFPDLGLKWDETGGFEQADRGPLFIVIGSQTSDDKCRRLGERFGVDPAKLISFREYLYGDGGES